MYPCNLFPPAGNLSPEMEIRKAMRIARGASLAYFHPRRLAGRYRRKRRHSAAPDDPVLMFSRERPARSTAPSVLLSAVEIPRFFKTAVCCSSSRGDNSTRRCKCP